MAKGFVKAGMTLGAFILGWGLFQTLDLSVSSAQAYAADLGSSLRKPDPDPTPVPTPTPAQQTHRDLESFALSRPPGAERLGIVNAFMPGNLVIRAENKTSRLFKYHVKVLVYGPQLAENHPVERILVSVYDRINETYVAPWTSIMEFNPAQVLDDKFFLDFTLDRFAAPSFLIERESEMILVFAINSETQNPVAFRALDLSLYCPDLCSGAAQDSFDFR